MNTWTSMIRRILRRQGALIAITATCLALLGMTSANTNAPNSALPNTVKIASLITKQPSPKVVKPKPLPPDYGTPLTPPMTDEELAALMQRDLEEAYKQFYGTPTPEVSQASAPADAPDPAPTPTPAPQPTVAYQPPAQPVVAVQASASSPTGDGGGHGDMKPKGHGRH